MYNWRNKFDLFWNLFVVVGLKINGETFLGTVGMIGTYYEDDYVCVGFGNYIVRLIFREFYKVDMMEE